tara:strand:+ start:44 stop:241 length:198 start_codon:yes stop_codon:yes gene_type:complete
MAYKMNNPYPKMGTTPTSRKGKVNPNSEGNTDLKDGRSKSSAFQNLYAGGGYYKKPGSKKSNKLY